MSESASSRPLRYEMEEEPGDVRQDKTSWVGAFERMIGDQGDSLAAGLKPKSIPSASNGSSRGRAREDDLGPEHTRTSAASSAHSSVSVSPLDGSVASVGQIQRGTNGEPDRLPMPSHYVPDSQLLPPPSPHKLYVGDGVLGSSHPTPKITRGFAEQLPPQMETLDSEDTAVLDDRASGPPLVSASQTAITFENTYLNHAPSLQLLTVNNLTNSKRVLVRLESNLSRGIAFMRRKRTAPKSGLSAFTWPSNGVSWARSGGFLPSKLRDLRHMTANLESSDSFILDPASCTDIFIMYTAVHFAPEDHSGHPKRQPTALSLPSPTLDDGAITAPRSDGEPISSRSSSQTSAATSPALLSGSIANLLGPGVSILQSDGSAPASESALASPISTHERGSHVHSMFEARGHVSLRAWALPATDALNSEDGTESSASTMSSAPSSRPTSFYSSHVSSVTSSSISVPTTEAKDEAQLIKLPVYASSCKPHMAVSMDASTWQQATVMKTEGQGSFTLDFGDMLVGQVDERVISISNLSEIDCFWQAKLEEADNMLQATPISIIDCESGEPVPTSDPTTQDGDAAFSSSTIAPRATRHLRICLRPQEPCRDYEQAITLSNLHNTSNSVRILFRANMLGSAKDDALSVLSGDVVDFGDCCGGHWSRQMIVLKNLGDALLDVSFSVQRGIEATFQLAELPTQTEEIHDVAPPPASGISSEMPLSPGHEGGISSTDDGGSFASSSSRLPDSPGSSAVSGNFEHTTVAQELARTPTHHALTTGGTEPPAFELSGSPAHSRQPSGKQTEGYAPEDDEVDASSVASQAGSRPGSPALTRASAPAQNLSREMLQAEESLAMRLERGRTGPASDSVSRVAHFVSDTDKVSVGAPRSMASSGLLSRPPSRASRHGGYRADDGERMDDAASSRSDLTALSQDSRLGPFPATSSQAGSGAGGRSHRTGGAMLSGLRNVEHAQSNHLEELVLRPGGEYRVVVAYRPPRGERDEEYTAGRLRQTTFRISLDYAHARSSSSRTRGGRERKTVLCQARTCTSFISVSPKLIDFGEANVGTRRSANIAVTNCSELTARVDLRFVSKVLSMFRDEVAIPPLQTVELKVDCFPRRVNESYRKQITVANLLNRHNDQIFEVRSRNVDQQRISFHSLFYRILTPTGSNFIDFGDVSINLSRLRTFSIENVSASKLVLDLSVAHPEDLVLYVKAPGKAPAADASSGALPSGVRTPKYAELEAPDLMQAADLEKGKLLKAASKGLDLKERFLETISIDSPASIRKENASWRLAQKNAHSKETSSVSATSKDGASAKPRAPLNLVSALKKGGKGRLTMHFGKSMTFKDRKLLNEFEYLDLATGPPVDAKRIPNKSKRYQMLEAIETGNKPKAQTLGRATKTHFAIDGTEGRSTKKTKQSSRRLPSPLAHDIQRKALTKPGLPGALGGKDASTADEKCSSRSPALTGKRKAPSTLCNATDVSKLSLEELLAAVEEQSSSLNTFCLGNPQAEERHVRTEINLHRELQNAITSGRLVPIDMLEVAPNEERQVIAVYTPNGSTRPHIQGMPRKQDSRIFLRLAEYDVSTVRASPEFAPMAEFDRDELPVRDLMVRSTTCRSLLELGQPHINFGHMEKGNSKARKILIQNRSEWALRFCIRKSGSIASGDIKLAAGRYGVVPGYGKREVEFVFSPSMSGQFQERLVVENVADRDNDQTVVLKANVRKTPNFAVDPASLDFGASRPGKLSQPESFVLTNTTAKPRTFVVAVDPYSLRFERSVLDLVLSTANDGDVRGTLTKEEEEEVENIAQKLKIAYRKGNHDKVKKYEGRLTELGIKPASTLSAADESLAASDDLKPVVGEESEKKKKEKSEPKSDEALSVEPVELGPASTPTTEDPSSRLKRVSSVVTVGLAGNQSKRLLLRVRACAVHTVLGASHMRPSNGDGAAGADAGTSGSTQDGESVSVGMRIHEVKNQDEIKTVNIFARVELDREALEAGCGSQDPLPTDAVVFSPPSVPS